MSFLAVDLNSKEFIYELIPMRGETYWIVDHDNVFQEEGVFIELPKGSIEKLIGKKLTWEDEAVEI